MASFGKKHASFFKFFMCDFPSKLRVPVEFGKKYGEMLPQISFLETESGKSWDIKITQVDEHFYLADGWSQFVKDNNIIEKDFLVFHLVSRTTFRVAIYGMDACLKEPSCTLSQKSQKSGKNAGTEDAIKSFTAVVMKHNTSLMVVTIIYHRNHNNVSNNIPKDLAKETGIGRKKAIKLQNVRGKEWEVNIYKWKKQDRIGLSKGWNAFRLANDLGLGTKCLFEFDAISGKIVVRGLSKTANMSSTNPAKKARGRPPKNMDVPAAKRGRGRLPENVDLPAAKRGKGRPPENMDVPAAKRGRGRPRKSLQN